MIVTKNRSISNNESKKLENYKKSKFKIVNSKLIEQYKDWDLDKCLSRKEYEINKVINFINE
jgi:hypothetical protein